MVITEIRRPWLSECKTGFIRGSSREDCLGIASVECPSSDFMETVKQPGWRLQTKAQVSWGQIKKTIEEMLTEYTAFNFRGKKPMILPYSFS
jgi:hypothetical protein